MNKCVFCFENFDSSEELLCRDLEHIIPDSLGGTRTFSHDDCHKKCNSELGSKIDAPFLMDPAILLYRQRFRLKNKKRRIPNIVTHAIVGEREGRVTISNDNIKFEPKFKMTRNSNGSINIEAAEHIARKQIKKFEKKHGKENLIIEQSSIEIGNKIHISMSSYDDRIALGMAKIAYNAAHYFIGSSWTQSDKNAETFRKSLLDRKIEYFRENVIIDAEEIEKMNLPFGNKVGFHEILLIPTPHGNAIFVSLFGEGISGIFHISENCYLLQAIKSKNSIHVEIDLARRTTTNKSISETWNAIRDKFNS